MNNTQTSANTPLTVSKNRIDTKSLVFLAVLCAIAYISVFFFRIQVVTFLKYEPKDVFIGLAAFIFSPMWGLVISVIVSLIEMVTISSTGPIGLLMNVLATICFVCPAGYIYKKRKTLSGAVLGLVAGSILMTAAMLLWNYLITPLYMNVPREVVTAMLVPAFLPFNLLKAGVNSVLILLIYKPVINTLRKAHLLPPSTQTKEEVKKGNRYGVIIVSIILLATFIGLMLVLSGGSQ